MADGVTPPDPFALQPIPWQLDQPHPAGFLIARWLTLRGIGIVFFSAFYSYAFQIQGLIGSRGISPAANYLRAAREQLPAPARYLNVPSLLWLTGAQTTALWVVVAAGLLVSLLLIVNCAPRIAVIACTLLFLSIISVSGVFASYQSDGMLLEAGLFSAFFAPGGLRPGLGAGSAPTRMARFMLVWEWFRIYFESGVVKLASGDTQWRDLTALDHYYENGPLPTWIGWYVQHLPHAFHAVTTLVVLLVELVLVWAAFMPRCYRTALFVVVTGLQVGIILTANYAFLNYLVLILGVLLVDDRTVRQVSARFIRWLGATGRGRSDSEVPVAPLLRTVGRLARKTRNRFMMSLRHSHDRSLLVRTGLKRALARSQLAFLGFVFYATLVLFPMVAAEGLPDILIWPAEVLAPFRFANRYGLFAVMTRERFEIEFQGTLDGETYVPYPFRYKPQDPRQAPGIYAPYQPRFEWNLWFASLGSPDHNRWVRRTSACLARAEPSVLRLFAWDPFAGARPKQVRAVIYRYWFTDFETLRKSGKYWNRELLTAYGAPWTQPSGDQAPGQ